MHVSDMLPLVSRLKLILVSQWRNYANVCSGKVYCCSRLAAIWFAHDTDGEFRGGINGGFSDKALAIPSAQIKEGHTAYVEQNVPQTPFTSDESLGTPDSRRYQVVRVLFSF